MIPVHSDWTIGVSLRLIREGEVIIQSIAAHVHEGIIVGEVSGFERHRISGYTRGCCVVLNNGVVRCNDSGIERTTFRMSQRNTIYGTYIRKRGRYQWCIGRWCHRLCCRRKRKRICGCKIFIIYAFKPLIYRYGILGIFDKR